MLISTGIVSSRTYETTLPQIDWLHPLNSQEFRGWSVHGQRERDESVFYALITSLFEMYCQPINPDELTNKVNQNIQTGYKELLDKELITDPVIELSLGLCILSGFMPFSIVKRTKNGEEVSLEITAQMWKYERIKRSGNVTETNVTLEAARIARALKTGLITAWNVLHPNT
jgi:hypothetical protein